LQQLSILWLQSADLLCCVLQSRCDSPLRSPVVIMCMHSVLIGGGAQYELLTTAADMSMIDRGYVFIPYDTLLYSLPYADTPHHVLGNDTRLRRAYDGVLTVTMDSGDLSFYDAFREAQNSFEIRYSTPPEQVMKQRNPWQYCTLKRVLL